MYRARRDRGLFAVACGGLALAFAALGLSAPHPLLALAAVSGGLAVAVGSVTLATRVTVDAGGLRKSPAWWTGFAVPWAAVDSWSVAPAGMDDSFTGRVARFRVRGRRRVRAVYDSEVGRPGFDPFLADVRAHVGAKEVAEPGAAADRVGVK